MLDRYSDDELRLLIEFRRLGHGVQARQAQWLRERLQARGHGGPSPHGRPTSP
jgi:hypothetical protein